MLLKEPHSLKAGEDVKTESHNIRPSGRLILDVYQHGRLIDHVDDRNLVVDNWKTIHAHLLGGDVVGKSITNIGFGTNGTEPAAGNTTLVAMFSKTIDAVIYPTINTVRFDFSLLSTENNGAEIIEFGLLTTSGLLYARRVRSSVIVKTSDIALGGSWIITF